MKGRTLHIAAYDVSDSKRLREILINRGEDDVRVYSISWRAVMFLAGDEGLWGVLVVADLELAPFLRQQLGGSQEAEIENE